MLTTDLLPEFHVFYDETLKCFKGEFECAEQP